MTKKQFMEELRSSLEGIVSPYVVQENLNYYEKYINEQIQHGRTEQEVLNELGNPRLIARTIIDAESEKEGFEQSTVYEDEQENEPEDMWKGQTHVFSMNSAKFKIGCVLSAIVFLFISYLLFHLFSAMMVVLGPVILIGIVVYLIMQITGR